MRRGPTTIADVARPSATARRSRRRPGAGSIWRDTLRNILRQRSAVRRACCILGFLVFMAIFADVIAPYDPNQVAARHRAGRRRRAPPCIHLLGCPADQPEHIFGTDGNVRDVFSRVVHGARISLHGRASLTIGFAIVIGATIGAHRRLLRRRDPTT